MCTELYIILQKDLFMYGNVHIFVSTKNAKVMTHLERLIQDIANKIAAQQTSNERAKTAKEVKDKLLRTHTAKGTQKILSHARKELDLRGLLTVSLRRVLKLSKTKIDSLNRQYQEMVKRKLETHEHQPILQQEAYIQTALDWLQSSSYIKIGLGLMVLTGRRTTEIFKTGSFVKVGKNTVLFDGQTKKRGTAKGYKIRTLCDAQIIVDALEKLRSTKDFSLLNEVQTSAKVAPQLNLQMLYLAKFIGKGCTPHDTRKAYIALTAAKYKPAKMSFRTYAAQNLGHEPNGLQTESYLKYIQF